jgi:hypothetical protein
MIIMRRFLMCTGNFHTIFRAGRGYSEQDVNSLATQQVDERELLLSRYESELATLHQSQYREFREVGESSCYLDMNQS